MDYINIVCYTDSIRVNSDFIKYYCSDLHLRIGMRIDEEDENEEDEDENNIIKTDEDDIIEVEEDVYYEVLARYNLYIREQYNTSDKGWFVVANFADCCLNTWRFNTLREAQEKQAELFAEGYAVSIFFGYTY